MNRKYIFACLALLCMCLNSLDGMAQKQRIKHKRLRDEVLIYLNAITEQPARTLSWSVNNEKLSIDTEFVDMDIIITVGEKLYEPVFRNEMLETAKAYAPIALRTGFNRIVTHFKEHSNSFPVTTVYYLPGARYKLTYSSEQLGQHEYWLEFRDE